MPPSPLVCIVEHDLTARLALDGLLRSSGLATALHSSVAEFRAAARGDQPGCLLMDVCLPGPSGFDFFMAMAAEAFTLPVVLMTGFGDIPMAVRAIKAGAIDVLPKPFTDQQVLTAVGAGIDADRTRRGHQSRIGAVTSRYATLTRREREVMALVTAGLMNKQAAWELGLSEVTVKIHRGKVMRKMGAKSLAELIKLAAVLG